MLGTMFWLSLLILPPISIGIMTYLLINGNRVALQRRRFDSIEQFAIVQKSWLPFGIIAGTVILLAVFAEMMLMLAALSTGA